MEHRCIREKGSEQELRHGQGAHARKLAGLLKLWSVALFSSSGQDQGDPAPLLRPQRYLAIGWRRWATLWECQYLGKASNF